ncbi:MAG: hypothetical protein IBX44_10635 [Sulfurospirillum sp.]|nr:hypothetical protein [Sulfurospirillum sp.]
MIQNKMTETIENLGIDKTAELLAEYVNQKIPSEDVAIQFVLEEIEAASQGNGAAKIFAMTSGFDEDDYIDAMHNSFEEVDGEDGPQQEILNLCMMLYPNQNLMADLRIKTVDNIMKHWKLGKYAPVNEKVRLIDVVKKNNNLPEGIFSNINNDLNDSITEDHDIMILMAYGYARRVAAAAIYLQGTFNREHYNQASFIFKSLQLSTGQSVEFQEEAAKQAEELLTSYNSRIDKEFMAMVTNLVETNQVISAYEQNLFFSDEQILEMFSPTPWKRTLIKDLIYLALIDGNLDDAEKDLFYDVAVNELGFTETKIADIMKNVTSDIMKNITSIEDIYPTNEDDIYIYFVHLLRLTYSNGYVDNNQVAYMEAVANKMNVDIDGIIEALGNI